MQASNFLEFQILNRFFRNINTPAITTHFLHLYISDPTDDDVGTEVTGGAYAPQIITLSAPVQVDGAAQISNTAQIVFPTATANWGIISHWGIRDAAAGGNLLCYAPVPTPKLIEAGDEARFNIGAITISMD